VFFIKVKILIPYNYFENTVYTVDQTHTKKDFQGFQEALIDVVSSKPSPDQCVIAADLSTSRKSAQIHQFILAITIISI